MQRDAKSGDNGLFVLSAVRNKQKAKHDGLAMKKLLDTLTT